MVFSSLCIQSLVSPLILQIIGLILVSIFAIPFLPAYWSVLIPTWKFQDLLDPLTPYGIHWTIVHIDFGPFSRPQK